MRFVRIGVGIGAGLALGWLMAGCPANITAQTISPPVTGADYGISVAPTSGPVSGGTVVTFTSLHGGFDARTSVLFGEESATDVRVYNDNVMTAIAPAGSQGAVTLRLHAPVDSKLRIMINDQGAGSVNVYEQRPVVINAGEFEYYVALPDDGTDSDGDGLTDAQETTGWEIWTEQFGLGLGTDTFGNVTRYLATSDPHLADTDGDGLNDKAEFHIRSDPGMRDTDGDGLWDGEELNRWRTSPTAVDSDADARGDRNLQNAPNQLLFDGTELFDAAVLRLEPGNPLRVLKVRATSPTLADTDGDGVSDFDEFDVPNRNGVNADLPLLNYQLVSDVDVKLNVEYAETAGETKEYGVTLTETQTETIGNSFSATVGWSFEIGTSVGYDDGSVAATVSTTAGIHGELSYGISQESSHESSRELSRVETDSREFTETASEGEIRTAFQLTNGGNTTFTVNGLGVLVSQRPKEVLGTTEKPQPKAIATLMPVFDSVTLAPGETAGPFELAATGVNADAIKSLMAAPDSLILGTENMDFTDSTGLDFDFVKEFTLAQTALVVINLGHDDPDGHDEVRQYTVATNVDRDDQGAYRGISLQRVLEENLALKSGNSATGYTTRTNAEGHREINSLLGRGYAQVVNGTETVRTKYWDMYWTLADGSKSKNPDFDNIRLKAGDSLYLMFQKDPNQDGVSDAVARAAGIDPTQVTGDADGDGLSNKQEILDGWVVFASPTDTGMQWANELTPGSAASSSRAGHPASAALVPTGGAPDTNAYGDPCPPPPAQPCPAGTTHTAWSPSSQNGTLEWIDVRVPTSVYATGATIRQTWGNGFVYQIDVSNGGVLETVWRGSDPSEAGAVEEFHVTWPKTQFLTRRLRVYVDTSANLDTFEDIDAIALHGYTDKRAYRVMSDPRFADIDEDGLNDAQEKAGENATGDPLQYRSSNPYDPDTDGDGLLDGEDPFPTIAARTVFVKADATAGTHDGNSWLNAHLGIQGALTRALNGQATPTNASDDVSQIWVAAGVYEPTGNVPIALVNRVKIVGGFTGGGASPATGETKLGQRNTDPFTNGCVITGDVNNNDVGPPEIESRANGRGENYPTVVAASAGIDSSALLDGFLITGAYQTQFDAGTGGALLIDGDASPTIQNCLFLANCNQKFGAGVVVNGGPASGKTLSFKRCIFASNLGRAGGGVYVLQVSGQPGEVVFEECEFARNKAWYRPSQTALQMESVGGGAYVVSSGRVHFNRSSFTGNQAWNQGGGVYALSSTGYLRVDSCRYDSNSTAVGATGGSFVGAGGGIYLDSSGGVSNSLFWDNVASSNGGGMAVNDSNATVANQVAITNCTLVYNRALPTQNFGWDGGGIMVWNASRVYVDNSIVWQNYFGASGNVIPDWDQAGHPEERHQIAGTATVRNCCLNGPGSFSGSGNISIDPSLANLELGDLRLGDQSPCIDRGNRFLDIDPYLLGLQRLPMFDLAGELRVVDGNDDGVIAVDMGAFEAPAPEDGPGTSN